MMTLIERLKGFDISTRGRLSQIEIRLGIVNPIRCHAAYVAPEAGITDLIRIGDAALQK